MKFRIVRKEDGNFYIEFKRWWGWRTYAYWQEAEGGGWAVPYYYTTREQAEETVQKLATEKMKRKAYAKEGVVKKGYILSDGTVQYDQRTLSEL